MVVSNLFELDDISLIPKVTSSVQHRKDVDTSVRFNGQKLGLPLLSAPMPDVTGWKMASSLAQLGCMGFVHRFQSVDEQVKEWHRASLDVVANQSDFKEIGAAVGASNDWRSDWFERFIALKSAGCKVICVDTANGANNMTLEAVQKIKNFDASIFVISGNVGSAETFTELESAGCDAIRVGIGTGRNCATAIETGIYTPLASLLLEVYRVRRQALIIADGGIRKPSHFVKALALGADSVMAGGIFAGTEESPGRVIVSDGNKYKIYRGAASFGVQKENGQKPIYNEGIESLTPYTGDVKDVVQRFENGLRSAMSYFDARNLVEFKEYVSWGILNS